MLVFVKTLATYIYHMLLPNPEFSFFFSFSTRAYFKTFVPQFQEAAFANGKL